MHEKSVSLDARLGCIAELVGKCDCYADVGCDHGRLGAFLLQHNWVREAILTDISAQSLQKAKDLIRLVGVEPRVQFLVCDGLEKLNRRVDCVVLAGMGGETIAGIVKNGKAQIGSARLILQANVAIPELRMYLCESGFRITDEKLVRDGRRFYVILCAECGSMHLNPIEQIAGPVLMRSRPEGFSDYVNYRLGIAKKAYAGALQGGGDASAILREVQAWEACLNGECP